MTQSSFGYAGFNVNWNDERQAYDLFRILTEDEWETGATSKPEAIAEVDKLLKEIAGESKPS